MNSRPYILLLALWAIVLLIVTLSRPMYYTSGVQPNITINVSFLLA